MPDHTLYILCEYSPKGDIHQRAVQQVAFRYPKKPLPDYSSHAVAELKRRFPSWQCPIILDMTLEPRGTWPATHPE